MVTLPDFENIYQVRSFIKKYQQLVKYLDICTGELETGAIRVDVNVSVAGGNRVELKNLRNTSDIIQAIEYEYFRQVELLKLGAPVQQETRGWNGSETVLQRSKEAAVDYRYFPDSELPFIRLSSEIKQQISNELPKFPTDIARELMSNPYNLELKHAKFLIDNKELLDYYTTLYESLIEGGIQGKFASNWIFNNLLATFKKLNKPVSLELVPVEEFKSLIKAVVSKEISKNDGNKILIRAIQENGGSLSDMIKEIAAIQPETLSSDEIVTKVISENPETVEKIKSGNLNSIKFLIGMAMKKSSGRGNSKEFEQKLKNLLDIQ